MKTLRPNRTREQLLIWERDIGHVHDPEFLELLRRLLAGDESVRETVERTCDEIDADLSPEERD